MAILKATLLISDESYWCNLYVSFRCVPRISIGDWPSVGLSVIFGQLLRISRSVSRRISWFVSLSVGEPKVRYDRLGVMTHFV